MWALIAVVVHIAGAVNAIRKVAARRLEETHRKGYKRYPVKKDEFSVWEKDAGLGG